jgi:hypothetical protein
VSEAALPLWLKLAFTGFIVLWLPLVITSLGWQNLLWLCDLANLLVLIGLWLESRLLLSSQLVATLVIGLVWTIDLASALALGVHPFAATEYLFDASQPLAPRLASSFHIAVPLMLLFAVSRLGHDRRGWRLQTGICWIVLALGAGLANPARNINWVEAPFGIDQTWLPDAVYLLACMVAYPLILYLPAEALLRRIFPASRRKDQDRGGWDAGQPARSDRAGSKRIGTDS